MRTIALAFACLLTMSAAAQTRIDKTITYQKGQTIQVKFDYPRLVKISTWDKNEVSITGTVSINGGENDDAFELITSSSGNNISIKNKIKNMDGLPQRVTVYENGNKIVFRNKAEWKKYEEEHGKSNRVNMGIDMEIMLEIKVPRNADTFVESVYGMVEVRDFTGPLTVQATYGGVDASLSEKSIGEIIAETNYGNIYSNLDIKLGDHAREEDFHTYVSAKPGSGPSYRFESPYGNVYLRKQ